MQNIKIIENISANEVLPSLNEGVLFRSRWQLSVEEGKKELSRIIESKILLKLNMKALYKFFPLSEVNDLNVQIPHHQNIVPLFAVTTGGNGAEELKKLYQQDKYFDYFIFNGLLSELAEALANYIDHKIKEELKFKKTKRLSPGYPLWKELSDQQKILNLLNGQKIGLTLTTAFQLIPEHSITGIVIT